MNKVTVRKSRLIEQVKANRKTHRTIFEEAIEGYRKACIKELDDTVARLKAGKVSRVYIMRPLPTDHTKDYDNALAMLDMEVNDEVTIDESTFRQLVMDDWSWRTEFAASTMAYSATAVANYGGAEEEGDS